MTTLEASVIRADGATGEPGRVGSIEMQAAVTSLCDWIFFLFVYSVSLFTLQDGSYIILCVTLFSSVV